jgi:hypothetical protein
VGKVKERSPLALYLGWVKGGYILFSSFIEYYLIKGGGKNQIKGKE